MARCDTLTGLANDTLDIRASLSRLARDMGIDLSIVGSQQQSEVRNAHAALVMAEGFLRAAAMEEAKKEKT